MYVLDTNVVSELRKGEKTERSPRMWAHALPHGEPVFIRDLGFRTGERNPFRRA
jgi:hypothetical protein